jgi:hypothetical protein
MKTQMVCDECGGTNVKRDAYAVWCVETQQWELAGDPFDAAYCEDCDGECHIDEIAIDEITTGSEKGEAR